MPIVPNARVSKIVFFETHADVWKEAAETIGITSGEAEQLRVAAAEARASYTAAQNARDVAMATTQTFHHDTANMATLGAGLLARIKAFAESTQNPDVYSIARIPPPAAHSPIPAPGKPTDFSVELRQDGTLELKWKCKNPNGAVGTIYECRRRIGAAPFVFIGTSGVRSFTDDTLPAGSAGVIYEITATRSTKRGLPALFNVNFGVGGDGTVVASVENVPVRMAA